MGGSPDVDGALSAKFHAVQAERYDCEERYLMVKVTVDFQYVIKYTSPKFFDSWASKNCMLGIKQLFHFQYLQYTYGELVRVFFAFDMLQR